MSAYAAGTGGDGTRHGRATVGTLITGFFLFHDCATLIGPRAIGTGTRRRRTGTLRQCSLGAERRDAEDKRHCYSPHGASPRLSVSNARPCRAARPCTTMPYALFLMFLLFFARVVAALFAVFAGCLIGSV